MLRRTACLSAFFANFARRLLALKRRDMLTGEEVCDVSCEEHVGA